MKIENFGKRLYNNKMATIELIDFYKYLLKIGTIKENGAAHKRMIQLTEMNDKQYREKRLNAFFAARAKERGTSD
tara:strand:+ start:5134 stop:5358 length:225 start_codon:yes stop_codon:yes gene_type:complete